MNVLCGCKGCAVARQPLLEAIERVRYLHKPVKSLSGFGPEACKACSDLTSLALGYEHWVAYAFCQTIRTLEGEQQWKIVQ